MSGPKQRNREGRMLARTLLISCVVSLAALKPLAAGILGDVPDGIVCDLEKGKLVVYAARQLEDGSTLYEALERQFTTVITIDPQGILRWENRPDCDGKSVDELRSEGKAFDFGG